MHSPLIFGARCAALAILLGALAGTACAAFTQSLEAATSLRFTHPLFVFAAPLVGVLTAALYRLRPDHSNRGNDLIFEQINLQNGEVPTRMAPLVFCTSTAAHLCGASVGREGAAVQISGGLAACLQRFLHLPVAYQRPLLLSGLAAGFGAIFGTPVAAAVFAVECPRPRQLHLRFLPLSLLAGFVGDASCRLWGIHHTGYPALPGLWSETLHPQFWATLLLAGLCSGWVALLYLRLNEAFRAVFQKLQAWWAVPFLAGVALCLLAQFPGTADYLGLGVRSPSPGAVTLETAFQSGGAHPWSWLAKLALTAFCLGGGFKGGEVTPLFFVGATFGNALATLLGQQPVVFAAFGFIAVFSAASHTPLAGICLAAELFGIQIVPWFTLVCFLAGRACGSQSLFHSQKAVA